MTLRSTIGAVRRRTLCSVHRRFVPLGNRGPIVSFCFDDFPRTAYTVGGSVLRNFGARGTYYGAIGYMYQSENLHERVTAEDLRLLVKDGHELANHTFSHVSSRALPLAAFREDVLKGQEAICEITGGVPPANFAYPFGEVTLAAKKALGSEMASCRGIYGGVNGPQLDLNLLRANSLYGDDDRLVVVEHLVSENSKQKGWLIFYTHDVSQTPSSFGCTPSLLESAVSCAVRYGARISTVAAVLSDLRAANPNALTGLPATE